MDDVDIDKLSPLELLKIHDKLYASKKRQLMKLRSRGEVKRAAKVGKQLFNQDVALGDYEMELKEAKKTKKSAKALEKQQCEEMDNLVKTMKEEGLSDEEIEEVFNDLEKEALNGIIEKLKNEGYSDDEIVGILTEEYEQMDAELEEENEEEAGEQLTPAQEIIIAAIDAEPSRIQAILDQEIKTRASGLVDDYKQHLAQNLFNNPPEPPVEDEEDEFEDEDEEVDGEPEDDVAPEGEEEVEEARSTYTPAKAGSKSSKVTLNNNGLRRGTQKPAPKPLFQKKTVKEALDPENDAPELVGVKKNNRNLETDQED
jgi:DNA-binding transcriptional regulator YhcF (GntR family)